MMGITENFDEFVARYHHKNMKKLNYQNSKLILTPLKIGGNSERDYKEQMDRIENGKQHVWDDSKYNSACRGDVFGYVWNQKKNGDKKTDGKINLYEILDVMSPYERLSSWSDNVGQGDRNVIVISSKSIYTGTMVEFKKTMNYSEKFNVQGTMCADVKKTHTYFDKILN